MGRERREDKGLKLQLPKKGRTSFKLHFFSILCFIFQRELRRNYADFTSQLYTFIGGGGGANSSRTPLASIQLPTPHPLADVADLGPVTAV